MLLAISFYQLRNLYILGSHTLNCPTTCPIEKLHNNTISNHSTKKQPALSADSLISFTTKIISIQL